MAKKKTVKLRIGAVQMESENGQVQRNLKKALPLIEEAAKKRAKLILLPEFMPTGYIFTTAIWDGAEPKNGPTVKWLRKHAKRLSVYLGTSFLEADGEDFYNTFVLAGPDGKEAGRVRKQTPAIFEAYFTKGESSLHVIETALGRIGVGICYENHLTYIPRLMHSQSVDILLMPHSAPTPTEGPLFPRKALEKNERRLRELAGFYSNLLGIPAVMANKCGPWETTLPGMPFLPQKSSFPGNTAIADSDGTVKAQLDSEAGVIVADVVLDPARKSKTPPVTRGRFFGEVPWPIYLYPRIETMGRIWYRLSRERKRRAREISSRG